MVQHCYHRISHHYIMIPHNYTMILQMVHLESNKTRLKAEFCLTPNEPFDWSTWNLRSFSLIQGLSNENLHIEGEAFSNNFHFSEMDAIFFCQQDQRCHSVIWVVEPVSFHHFEFDNYMNKHSAFSSDMNINCSRIIPHGFEVIPYELFTFL